MILASANQYEEPRLSRRGSHRPETYRPVPMQTLSGDDSSPSQYCPSSSSFSSSPPPLDHSPLDPDIVDTYLEEYAHQSQHETAYFFYNHPGPRRGIRIREWHAGFARPPPSSSSSSVRSPSPISWFTREAIDAQVRSSLDLIHQLRGGACIDPMSVEQSIRESYARSAPQSAACQSVQKRCMFPNCTKISVSRGLCRGHGGGRRCHVPGCAKSAQSRSNFCWAHGGGQRCEADQCKRSRKSKRFCVAHLHLEMQDPSDRESRRGEMLSSPTLATSASTPTPTKAHAALPLRALPSLGQALSSASRSMPNLPMRYKVHCA